MIPNPAWVVTWNGRGPLTSADGWGRSVDPLVAEAWGDEDALLALRRRRLNPNRHLRLTHCKGCAAAFTKEEQKRDLRWCRRCRSRRVES